MCKDQRVLDPVCHLSPAPGQVTARSGSIATPNKGTAQMKIHPIGADVQKLWKVFPVRIPGGSKCFSCQEETVLVQSMTGGFVTRNCPGCGKFDTLPEQTFNQLRLWVACPGCKRRMTAAILPDKNYGYVCNPCDIGVPLFALLPRYVDL